MLPVRSTQNEKEMKTLLSTAEKHFIDATERRIQRPDNQAEQEDAYSGKKKPIR
jgi:hypothetical protein